MTKVNSLYFQGEFNQFYSYITVAGYPVSVVSVLLSGDIFKVILGNWVGLGKYLKIKVDLARGQPTATMNQPVECLF